eukprot:TRINITY_DN16920_c0_g2_i1.p1 TRINITY_DN16920_c0_g2~~TRINITY_DN16920_c0_g2_i1.p1  ORF type:complete len:536 (-),score=126.14 TRINITY_DN16920_c0_g2_i1:136-1743(-)
MVRFGDHIKRLDKSGWGILPVLDYEKLKALTERSVDARARGRLYQLQEEFADAWQDDLERVDDFYKTELRDVLCRLYVHIESSGQSTSADLWKIVEGNPQSLLHDVDELLSINRALQRLVDYGEVNSEGFRKSVKKFDKVAKASLSTRLMPALHVSGCGSDEFSRRLLRACSGAVRKRRESTPTTALLSGSETASAMTAQREFDMRAVPDDVRAALILQQGRPQSQAADLALQCESAWSTGVQICVFEVGLTCDGWLALKSTCCQTASSAPQSPMFMSRRFGSERKRSNSSSSLGPAQQWLLAEALQMAHTFGPHARLALELRPASVRVGCALASFLAANPLFVKHVALVMSLDLYIMHEFSREVARQAGGLLPRPGEERPLIMLMSVDQPAEAFEVRLQLHETPLEQVQALLKAELDGVFLQWAPRMLVEDMQKKLAALAEVMTVGIWRHVEQATGHALEQAAQLVALGAQFIRTDLPEQLLEDDYYASRTDCKEYTPSTAASYPCEVAAAVSADCSRGVLERSLSPLTLLPCQ